jgi:hypothetical protein
MKKLESVSRITVLAIGPIGGILILPCRVHPDMKKPPLQISHEERADRPTFQAFSV